jgi:hypothetical protein
MTQNVIRKGNLEYRERKPSASGTEMQPVLVQCPICGKEFRDNVNKPFHFLNEHTPSDFGLTPLK